MNILKYDFTGSSQTGRVPGGSSQSGGQVGGKYSEAYFSKNRIM